MKTNMESVGREAARAVVNVREPKVCVTEREGSTGEPIYFFSFSFEQNRDRARAALLRTRLSQKIRDELIELGDGHFPFVCVLNNEEWEQQLSA